MGTIEVFHFLNRKILVTRESASALRDAIDSSIKADGEVTLDFTGIDAVTPSFVDELLAMINDARAASSRRELRVVFAHTPTPLSAKFLAIGRRHGATMSQSGSDSWEISNVGIGAA
jgi:uncharacterized protein DUF4325